MANEKKSDGEAIVTRRIKLLSYLSGKDDSLPPGSEIDLDETEALRLIDLGAAVAVKSASVDEEQKG